MSEQVIPWWMPPFPRAKDRPVTLADLWDALFGRIETFCKVELDGSWFICDPREVWEWVPGDGNEYTITEVRMTRRQFNSLPEFEGF